VLPGTEPGAGDLGAELAREAQRVAERLRTLSQARLEQPVDGCPSRADAGRAAAQEMADVAALLEAAAIGVQPVRRAVPDIGVFGVGDQVAVTGHDLSVAWGQRASPAHRDRVVAALEQLRAVRRVL
jgi:hypothetical protein